MKTGSSDTSSCPRPEGRTDKKCQTSEIPCSGFGYTASPSIPAFAAQMSIPARLPIPAGTARVRGFFTAHSSPIFRFSLVSSLLSRLFALVFHQQDTPVIQHGGKVGVEPVAGSRQPEGTCLSVHIPHPCFHSGIKVYGLRTAELLAGRLQINAADRSSASVNRYAPA